MGWSALITCRFDGPPFEDHGIDLLDLRELLTLRELLVEIAKELWRQDHPHRDRLPPNYEASFGLRFYRVDGNCTTITIHAQIPPYQGALFPELEVAPPETVIDLRFYLWEAAELIVDASAAVSRKEMLPARLPRKLVFVLHRLGETLAPQGGRLSLLIPLNEGRPTLPVKRRGTIPFPQEEIAEVATEAAGEPQQEADRAEGPPIEKAQVDAEPESPAQSRKTGHDTTESIEQPEQEASTPYTPVSIAARTVREPSADPVARQSAPQVLHASPTQSQPAQPLEVRPEPSTPPLPTKSTEATFTKDVRDRLETYIPKPYEDSVDFTGEVTAASLKGRATIDVPRRGDVQIDFSQDDERRVLEALLEHNTVRLKIRGRGIFEPNRGRLIRISRVDSLEIVMKDKPFDKSAPSLLVLADEFWDAIPEDERARVPEDMSENLDHYLYGSPKRTRGQS